MVNKPNLNNKYDNSTIKKFNQPVAFAAHFSYHLPRARFVCTFINGASS